MKKFLSIPNVSRFVLLLLVLHSEYALAAYKVLEDEYLVQEDAPIIQKDSPKEANYKTEPVYHHRVEIPFHAKRFQLGSRGRSTLLKSIKDAGQFTLVRITGKGDRPGDTYIADERAKTVKSLLIKNNVHAEITSSLSDEVSKDKSPDVYTISVEFGNLSRTIASGVSSKQAFVIAHSTIFDDEDSSREKNDKEIKSTIQKPASIKTNWALMKHLSLRDNLVNWCKEAGWNELIWHSDDPYALDKSVTLKGTFIEAISLLANGVPGLDFEVDKKNRRLTVTDAK